MGKPGEASVEAFIAALDHPLKREIAMLREQLLAIDPAIGEQIKWNAPSFHTTAHFATMQLRQPDVLRLILHRGAKARQLPAFAIDDPDGLLTWLAPDRALLQFRNAQELADRQQALVAIVRQWLKHV